ncbi:hypothetical protein D3C72_2196450 [compost metagenome]
MLTSNVDHSTGIGDVLIHFQVRTVIHYRTEACVNRRLDGGNVRAVIQMQAGGNILALGQRTYRINQQPVTQIFGSTGRNLDHQRAVHTFGSFEKGR